MMLHRFCIPEEPVAWARARLRGGHHWTNPVQKRHRKRIQIIAQIAGVRVTDQPVTVSIRFNLAIPKSGTKAEKAAMLAGARRPTKKPDLDNLGKQILDALNAIAWVDDAQVVGLAIEKHWAAEGSTQIEIHSGRVEFPFTQSKDEK